MSNCEIKYVIKCEKVYVGQTEISFIFEILNNDNEPMDLTTLVNGILKYVKPNGTTGSWIITIQGDPTLGLVEYDIQTGDIDIAGIWKLQLVLEFPANNILPFEPINQYVYEQIF